MRIQRELGIRRILRTAKGPEDEHDSRGNAKSSGGDYAKNAMLKKAAR